MPDAVICEAIKLRDQLLDVAKEIRYRDARTAAAVRLRELDASRCEAAARMLEKLGTEVMRLRLGIGHLRYGRMSVAELDRMTRDWNGTGGEGNG